MRLFLLILLLSLLNNTLLAQTTYALLDGERWWSGQIAEAAKMPFAPGYSADLSDNAGNQVQPLLLSNKGRYVYATTPFAFRLTDTTLVVTPTRGGKAELAKLGNDLPTVYRFVAENYFKFQGEHPHELLFTRPQYNTWIELIYDQNQADIMKYARGILAAGFPPGVLMIDDNWQRDYGDWQFRADRFPDPKGMIDSLHQMGFQVMLWVCPFVSPDSEPYRLLSEQHDAFLKDPNYPTQTKLVKWWNGFSALLDFSNPAAETWFKAQLDRLQADYGVDGFKLDGGDFGHYEFAISHVKSTKAYRQSQRYARIGLDYPLNEYRACYGLGGYPLAQRLRDKAFDWSALQELIPGMTLMGMMGYPFACPDMIGGGEYRSFLALDGIDQELIVRSAQVHALMPMMQFSVAPWRVLDGEHLAACLKAAELHTRFGPTIIELTRAAAGSGSPIVSSMAYAFPGAGLDLVRDQFMLGTEVLVAPVMVSGARSRSVALPAGNWRYVPSGKVYQGGQSVEVAAPLDVLPYFEKQ